MVSPCGPSLLATRSSPPEVHTLETTYSIPEVHTPETTHSGPVAYVPKVTFSIGVVCLDRNFEFVIVHQKVESSFRAYLPKTERVRLQNGGLESHREAAMQFVYHEKNGEPQYDVGFPIRLQSYDKKKIRDSISFPFEEVNEINDFKFFNITSCGAINGDCSYTEWFVGFYDPPGRRFDLVHPDKNWRVRTYSIKHAICFILDQGKTALLAFMLQFTEDRLAFRTPDIPEEVQTLTELRDWLEDKQLSEERLQQSYVDRVDDAATSSSPMPLAGLSMVTKPEEE